MAAIILLPLLGVTWAMGLLAVNQNTTVFTWLFTLFNSLQVTHNVHKLNAVRVGTKSNLFSKQGLFFFVFHVIRSDKVIYYCNTGLVL